MTTTAPQFSTPALTVLSAALRKWQAEQALVVANRQRTALALGVEPGEVTEPFSYEFIYAGSAAKSF